MYYIVHACHDSTPLVQYYGNFILIRSLVLYATTCASLVKILDKSKDPDEVPNGSSKHDRCTTVSTILRDKEGFALPPPVTLTFIKVCWIT